MSDRLQSSYYDRAVDHGAQNRVLRNTYWLLAASLAPTVLGAWVGLVTGVGYMLRGWLGLAVFLGGAWGFMWAIQKNRNSGAGVALLLGFTFFMGVMLSRLVGMVLGMGNGEALVMSAMGGTAGVFAVMAMLSSVIKRDLSGMGRWLSVGAVITFVGFLACALLSVFFSGPALPLLMAMCGLSIVVFSLYMLYDIKQIIDGGETNYVMATLNLYLDIYNVFQSLLTLLGLTSND
ncbi:MAG: Bax inhibitor-1 family protein [Ottowia sp.]